jgi:hypothetical protein
VADNIRLGKEEEKALRREGHDNDDNNGYSRVGGEREMEGEGEEGEDD